MSNFGLYDGVDFMKMHLPKREFLIEKFIQEKDSVILVGDDKAGKSLITFQMICSLTTKHPFLDRFKVKKPCKVSYVQCEGELEDTQLRFKRMTKVIDFDPKNFQIDYSSGLDLGNKEFALNFMERFREFKPDILVLDPVYASMSGDLSDNKAVRDYTNNLRIIKDSLNCCVLLIHHTHRIKYNQKTGKFMEEGDNAIFGSRFFKAWADHTLLFAYDDKNNLRIMQCQTQRSANIEKSVKMILHGKEDTDPLYFEETDQNPTREDMIIVTLNKHKEEGITKNDFVDETKLSEQCFYRTVKKMLGSTVKKDDTVRPVRYYIMGEGT